MSLIDREKLRAEATNRLWPDAEGMGQVGVTGHNQGVREILALIDAAPPADPLAGLRADEVVEWLNREDGRLGDIFGLWTQGKRDDRWVAEQLLDEGHIAALRATSSEGQER